MPYIYRFLSDPPRFELDAQLNQQYIDYDDYLAFPKRAGFTLSVSNLGGVEHEFFAPISATVRRHADDSHPTQFLIELRGIDANFGFITCNTLPDLLTFLTLHAPLLQLSSAEFLLDLAATTKNILFDQHLGLEVVQHFHAVQQQRRAARRLAQGK